jgi:AcrR family transcriptional regulator
LESARFVGNWTSRRRRSASEDRRERKGDVLEVGKVCKGGSVANQSARIPNASRGRRGEEPSEENEQARRGTGRTARGRQTRQHLIESARTVFERQGFLHARISDICKEAKISHGSFYTYFTSKEAIFTEVVDSVEINLLRIDAPIEETDPTERIRFANRHYLQSFQENADILRVIEQVSTFDDEVLRIRVAREAEFAGVIERRTREYQKAGLVNPDIDASLAARALGGMVAGFAEQMFFESQTFDFDHAVDQLTLLWVNALGLQRS